MLQDMVLHGSHAEKVEAWLEQCGITAKVETVYFCVVYLEETDAVAFKLAFAEELEWFPNLIKLFQKHI